MMLSFAIAYEDSPVASLRLAHGNLLPTEIILASPSDRIAQCQEFANLLASELRAAGIDAGIRHEPGHAYVVAMLNGQPYRLDPAQNLFTALDPGTDYHSDRESISAHYSNEGSVFNQQTRACTDSSIAASLFQQAESRFRTALELDPTNFNALLGLGLSLSGLGRHDEAVTYLEQAAEFSPTSVDVQLALRDAYNATGNHLLASEASSQVEAINQEFYNSATSHLGFDVYLY